MACGKLTAGHFVYLAGTRYGLPEEQEEYEIALAKSQRKWRLQTILERDEVARVMTAKTAEEGYQWGEC